METFRFLLFGFAGVSVVFWVAIIALWHAYIFPRFFNEDRGLNSVINQEIKEVKKDLTKYSKKVEDKAVAVKLNETKGMIKPLCKKSSVHDDNVINLLNYYELINELKTIHG